MIRVVSTLTLLMLAVLLTAQAPGPRIPTEAEKKQALMIAYAMNGFSMERWGSIDLSSLFNWQPPDPVEEFIGPLQPEPLLRKQDKEKAR